MVQSLNNAEMSSLEKNTGRDCQPRGHVTVFNPADNRSAGGAHWRLRCVWLRQRGMWFGVKVLISWPLRLESSWRSGAVFVQQEQAHQLRTASFCLGISAVLTHRCDYAGQKKPNCSAGSLHSVILWRTSAYSAQCDPPASRSSRSHKYRFKVKGRLIWDERFPR